MIIYYYFIILIVIFVIHSPFSPPSPTQQNAENHLPLFLFIFIPALAYFSLYPFLIFPFLSPSTFFTLSFSMSLFSLSLSLRPCLSISFLLLDAFLGYFLSFLAYSIPFFTQFSFLPFFFSLYYIVSLSFLFLSFPSLHLLNILLYSNLSILFFFSF